MFDAEKLCHGGADCPNDAGTDGYCPPHRYRLAHFGSTFPAVPLGELLPLGRPVPGDPQLFD